MSIRTPRFLLLFAILLWCGLVLLSVLFVDLPAASWSHDHLQRPSTLVALTHLVDPLVPLAVGTLVLLGLSSLLFSWTQNRHCFALIRASLAVLVSVSIKEQLKLLFGRTWPETWINNNPSWIQSSVHRFEWLHGGQGWASFPSGHTTLAATLATTVWLEYPKARPLAVTYLVLVAVGLWGANFHYVGDILAGALLGCLVAVSMKHLITGRKDTGTARN